MSDKGYDWSFYTSNPPWIPERTFFLTRYGSHAYGTSTPESDLDIRGIAIPPSEYFHGFLKGFEQVEIHKPDDIVVFGLHKFFKLSADCNPNTLEIIFTDESDHLYRSRFSEMLLEKRDLFLSRRVKHTFSGYAMSQLKRIKAHRRWYTNPLWKPPTRKEFDLPERTVIPADQLAAAQSAVDKRLALWNLHGIAELDPDLRIAIQNEMSSMLAEANISTDNQWMSAARVIGLSENFIELLDRERRYNAAQREWENFGKWKRDRNPKRAMLEAKFGIDTKHFGHLVRLLRVCRELLTTGKMNVRRHDAAEILAIRDGSAFEDGTWNYEKGVEWAVAEDLALDQVMDRSVLPYAPDKKALEALCIEMVEMALEPNECKHMMEKL